MKRSHDVHCTTELAILDHVSITMLYNINTINTVQQIKGYEQTHSRQMVMCESATGVPTLHAIAKPFCFRSTLHCTKVVYGQRVSARYDCLNCLTTHRLYVHARDDDDAHRSTSTSHGGLHLTCLLYTSRCV